MDGLSIQYRSTRMAAAILAIPILALSASSALGQDGSKTYTLDADFAEGTLINVTYDTVPDQLQLIDQGEAFNFIWVAASARGTIVKIDTETGAVLGEYRSAPEGRGLNPSRTTVDANGNVWAGNRDEFGLISGTQHGSVVMIGLEENGQCIDRNGNDIIDTSTGLGDILAWPDVTDGVGGSDGLVEDALDECILIFQRTPDAEAVRHVSVDPNNDIWIGGYPFQQRSFHKLDGGTGAILDTFDARRFRCGGYGGLIDGNGILWSASIGQSKLLRYNPASDTGTCIPVSSSYGLGIDTNGFVWNSMFSNDTIVKVSPAGVIEPLFPKQTFGASGDRGVAVTAVDNNVWVANSFGSDVSRLDNLGNLVTTIAVGITPTGIAVDAAGKVWVTNLSSDNVMRIDPATDLVDLTVDLGPGAGPYNYSDMTGSTLTAPPDSGTWEVFYDSGFVGAPWSEVSWTADTPGNSSITVTVASSTDGVTFSTPVVVSNGADPGVPDGQYLWINVAFDRSDDSDANDDGIFDGPILYDLTAVWNRDPDCSFAAPSIDKIWPPNHKFVAVDVFGVTDPDGDPVAITIDSIFQDEPVDSFGDGTFTPDGMGVGTPTAHVRAERSGSVQLPGDGRVYHIGFTADDGRGGFCSGAIATGVPHDVKDTPVDGGALYDSTTF
jgi:streptogramin lyase